MDRVTLRTPGKINLLLRVTGRRSDGFHELVTLFHALPRVADEISADLTAAPGIAVSCSDPEIPEGPANLAWKAAARFADRLALRRTWAFHIAKKIPAAAGMGGGSSDAGAVLALLDRRFPGIGREELVELAASIGADVPFFLAPGDAAARGIGEKLTPLPPLPVPPLLIVSPGFPVSAAWAYRHLARMTPPEQAEQELEALTAALRRRDFSAAARLCANDLEEALFKKFPLLSVIRRELQEKGALCVHVSGSGPVLFALFRTEKERSSAARFLGAPGFSGGAIKVTEAC